MKPWQVRAMLVLGAGALALVPLSGDRFWLQFLGKAMITCIFAMSLDLLVGFVGLVSLAHAAFFGLSAYLLTGLTTSLGLVNPIVTLPLCLAGAALAALFIGWLSLRAAGVYFIMVTLAFTQMLFYLFNDAPWLGGSDGLYVAERPRVALGGRTLLDLGDGTAAYFAVWVALVIVYLALGRALRAPFGHVLALPRRDTLWLRQPRALQLAAVGAPPRHRAPRRQGDALRSGAGRVPAHLPRALRRAAHRPLERARGSAGDRRRPLPPARCGRPAPAGAEREWLRRCF